GHRVNPTKRLGFEIGDPDTYLEVFQQREHLQGGAKDDGKGPLGVLSPERCGEGRYHGECGGNGCDPDMPCEPAPGCAHLLPHGSDISYDAPGPFQHPLPLGSKALKTRATDRKSTRLN